MTSDGARIKAIETRYKGYRFRSRLEARWAVFLDALRLPWEYEKEGYDLGGLLYLPDFWLPRQRLWMEVKASPDLLADDEREKCRRLALGTGCNVGMVFGGWCPLGIDEELCLEGNGYGWYADPAAACVDGDAESVRGEACWGWAYCPAHDRFVMGCHGMGCCPQGSATNHPRILAAYAAARSARFEFGESGVPRG